MQKYELFIGIDILKKWIDICLSFDGQIASMCHRQFNNNEDGFIKMLNFITAFEKKHQRFGKWLFCMEHTGLYVLPLCNFLEEQALGYILQSALEIIQSVGIRRSKSDTHDAALITRYVYLHHPELKPSLLSFSELLKIKHLLSLRSRLVKARKNCNVAAKELGGFSVDAIEVQQLISDNQTLKKTIN